MESTGQWIDAVTGCCDGCTLDLDHIPGCRTIRAEVGIAIVLSCEHRSDLRPYSIDNATAFAIGFFLPGENRRPVHF